MPLTHVLSYQCFGVKWALSRIHFHTHAPTKVLALTGFFHTGPLHTRSATKVLALTGLFHTCPSHTRSATKVLALSGHFPQALHTRARSATKVLASSGHFHTCTFTHVLSYQGFGVNWALSHRPFTHALSYQGFGVKWELSQMHLHTRAQLPRFWR